MNSLSNKIFNQVLTHKKILLVLLFLITVLLRVPRLFLTEYNDPGGDAASHIDGARNIKDGNGYKVDFLQWFNRNDGFDDNNSISHPAYWYPPVYSMFLAVVFLLRDSLFAAAVAQILLCGILIVLLYLLTERLFGQKIAVVSALLVMFNPFLYWLSVIIMSEILYLTLCVVIFYLLIAKSSYVENNQFVALSGFLTGMAFLTRYAGVTIAVGILAWLILRRRFKAVIIYGVCAFFTGAPWFLVRNYIVLGDPLIRLHSTGFYYPPVIVSSSIFQSNIEFYNLWRIGQSFWRVGGSLSSPDFFFILLPFVIIGSIKYFTDERISLLIIFSIVLVLFHSVILKYINVRYLIPLVVFLVPVGVKTLVELLRHWPNRKILSIRSNKSEAFLILIISYLLVSCSSIVSSTKHCRETNFRDELNYKWLVDNAQQDSRIAATLPHRCHYFTNLESVMLPLNLDKKWLDKFIIFYNISYIVVEERMSERYPSSSFIGGTLFKGQSSVKTGINELTLACESEGYYAGKVWIYKVNRLNPLQESNNSKTYESSNTNVTQGDKK